MNESASHIPSKADRLEEALRLARLDLFGLHVHVFPSCWPIWPDGPDGPVACGDGGNGLPHTGRDIGKAPLTWTGHLAAVTLTDPDPKVNAANERKIREWWRTWPSANVSVALMWSSLLAVDCDAPEAVQEAQERGLPSTAIRYSGNGPAYVYRHPNDAAEWPNVRAIHQGESGKIDVLAGGYLVVFGQHANGDAIYLDFLDMLNDAPSWCGDILKAEATRQEHQAQQRSADLRPQGAPLNLDDAELVKRMVGAKNGPAIQRLLDGDWKRKVGDPDYRYPSHSEADQGLFNHLAWWTRRDRTRMLRIWASSGLYRPEKRDSYLRATIDKAIAANPYGYAENDPEEAAQGPRFEFDDDGPAEGAAQAEGDAPPDSDVTSSAIPTTIRDARERFAPLTLDAVLKVFRRWLYLKDDGPVLVVLATVAANLMHGDPLWLMLVGASSGGKTEILVAAARLWGVFMAAVLTESSLLSGTSKREKAKEAKGGLLREIGPWGILALKDFTSILSMNRDPRAALLAALREIYDGSWTRHVGSDGGRTLHWAGKVGLVAGCTTIIDVHHAVMAAMGERFVLYRLPELPPREQAKQALRNAGREQQMRDELASAVGGLFAGIEWPERHPDLSEDETDRLVALASLAARARSAVERDGRTRDVELIPDSEAPARLVQALRRLYGGLIMIGVSRDTAWPLVAKVGLDCMPKLRRSVFVYLSRHPGWSTTTAIATDVGYPTQTARRSLEDLMVHGLVLREPGPKGKPDNWQLAPMAREWLTDASVPEMSVDQDQPSADDSPSFDEDECTVGDFSGTPSGERVCWSCGAGLLEESDEQCAECGWLTCRCGACGRDCDRQAG